jgi:hypothetical protein
MFALFLFNVYRISPTTDVIDDEEEIDPELIEQNFNRYTH